MKTLMKKFGPFAALYAAQGIPDGFIFMLVLVASLQGEGNITAGQSSLFLILVGLPWVAKPMWGVVMDRWRPGERMVLAMCGAAMTVTTGAMLAFEKQYWPILALALAHNLFRSLQDVTTDGIANRSLSREERAAVQVWMNGGVFAGRLLGGAGLLELKATGWTWGQLCGTTAILILIVSIAGTVWLKPSHGGGTQWNDNGITRQTLLAAFSMTLTAIAVGMGAQYEEMLWTSVGVVFLVPALWFSKQAGCLSAALMVGLTAQLGGQAFTAPVVGNWFASLSYKAGELAHVDLANNLATIVGILLGGVVAKLLPHRVGLAVGALTAGLAYTTLGLGQAVWDEAPALLALIGFTSLSDGLNGVVLCTAFMATITDKRVAATQFALFMASLNLSANFGQLVGGYVGVGVETKAEFADFFILGGAVQLVALLPILWFRSREKEAPK